MNSLKSFRPSGEGVSDPETEEIIVAEDENRSLVRFLPGGESMSVFTRMNYPLLKLSIDHQIIVVKPKFSPEHFLGTGKVLEPKAFQRALTLAEKICEAIESSPLGACQISAQTGSFGYWLYFVTEDASRFSELVEKAAKKTKFEVYCDELRMSGVAHIILPRETVGDLGIVPASDHSVCQTVFEFTGHPNSIEKFENQLALRGFAPVSFFPAYGKLEVSKEVPIDEHGFLEVLRDIVPLGRSLGCIYSGNETTGGDAQFQKHPDYPIPEKYRPSKKESKSFFGGLFGKRN
jgi:hypothetical protein